MNFCRLFLLILSVLIADLSFSMAEDLDLQLRQQKERIVQLESQLNQLQQGKSWFKGDADVWVVSFLFASFCALWAQNSNRSGFLWFILGFIFSILSVMVLLAKNSNDIDRARVLERRARRRAAEALQEIG